MHCFAPEVVGISLRNLDSSSFPQNTSYMDDYKALVEAIRSRSDAPIVLGGAGFTVMPTTILRCSVPFDIVPCALCLDASIP